MYFLKKDNYKDKIFDEVNPLQNKKLGTEVETWSVVAFDDSNLSWTPEEIMQFTIKNSEAIRKSGLDIMEFGIPVGIQSWIVTKSKIIGKQMIVDKDYSGKGICAAMMVESGKHLKDSKKLNGDPFEVAYIGCSQYSKPILENKFGLEPFYSSEEKDMYKFNIPLELLTSGEIREKLIRNRNIGVYQ